MYCFALYHIYPKKNLNKCSGQDKTDTMSHNINGLPDTGTRQPIAIQKSVLSSSIRTFTVGTLISKVQPIKQCLKGSWALTTGQDFHHALKTLRSYT